jgi:hypothetical protein
VREATQHHAETRDPSSQDPRDRETKSTHGSKQLIVLHLQMLSPNRSMPDKTARFFLFGPVLQPSDQICCVGSGAVRPDAVLCG